MKKIISLLLIAVMCFGFVACNVSTGSSESSDGSLSTLAPSLSNDGTKPEDSPSSSGNSTTKPNDSTSNSGGSTQNPTNTPFRIDLAGYVANIGNASALGIAKISSVSPTPATVQRSIEVKFLSATMFSEEESREPEIKDAESKNYIVMSTTEYGANTPEADETGLTKVSFTKTVTENVTTETTGTKYITASEGQISILAVE